MAPQSDMQTYTHSSKHKTWLCLCHPSDVRNVGGAIRVVANFNLAGLKVVLAPEVQWPLEQLKAFSSGALESIQFERFERLAEATETADLLIGTSRRPRVHPHQSFHKSVELEQLIAKSERPHILFGNERFGLSHNELDLCHALVELHSSPQFPSLNLAHAVACVAYELTRSVSLQELEQCPALISKSIQPLAQAKTNSKEDEAFLRRVIEVCERHQYPPGKSAELYAKQLRSLIRRAQPKPGDYGLILGLFRELDRLNTKDNV